MINPHSYRTETPYVNVRKCRRLSAETADFTGQTSWITTLITVRLQVAKLGILGAGCCKLASCIVELSFEPHVGPSQSLCNF